MRTWLPPLLLLVSGCAPLDDAQVQLADAGSDVWGQPGQRVQLDGTDAAAAELQWRFAALPPGSALQDVDLQDAQTPWAWFVGDVEGLYTLELQACEVAGCATDRALVGLGEHLRPHGSLGAPVLGTRLPGTPGGDDNQAPEAAGSAARALGRSGIILLDASGSQDPDGDSLRYRWSFAQRPAGSQLTNADIQARRSAEASFTPDVAGSYTLSIWVSDGAAADTALLPPVVVVDRGWDDWDPLPD